MQQRQAERLALYGLPDFDDFQRAEFFAFNEVERALAERRKGRVERLHCLLQMGHCPGSLNKLGL